jgi:hypothetical protein
MGLGDQWLAERRADKAEDAANVQAASADRAAELVQQRYESSRQDLAPFREAGVNVALPRLLQMASGQTPDRYSQIMNSPIFKDMLEIRDRSTAGRLAQQGRIGTGDQSLQFAQNVMATALPLIDVNVRDEQITEQRLNNLLSAAQASAAMTGQQGINAAQIQGDLGTQAANSIAAGMVAKENIRQQPINNALNAFTSLGGAFLGG